MMRNDAVRLLAALSVLLSVCPSAFAAPSEDFLDAARAAYVRPEYAACTNTVVTQWTTTSLKGTDRPTPGGRIGWVAVEGMRNVRDIGGWNGLRPGRAYRGTEPDGHRKDGVPVHGLEVTSNGLETVRSVMRIKTDLDLRGTGECPHPDVSSLGVALVRAPVRAYDGMDATKDQWAAALRLFADARHYPIYFHCWGGADRTGQLAFLLEGLCGVSECDLCIDYELTTFGGFTRLRSRGFVDLLNRIKSRPGATLKDRFADFVEREFGLTKREVAAIRRNLTEEQMDDAVPAVLTEFAKSEAHPRNSEGDVIGLHDGRLLVVYSHFYRDSTSRHADGGDDDSSAELVLTESADGGRTWSPMRTAVRKGEGTLNVMSTSFLRLGDGRLALFYLNKISSADCRPVMVVSSDEGATWSAPVDCVDVRDKGYYILNNARAVRLKSGRIALPLALHPFDGKRHEEGAFLLCALSDDDGRTWRLSSDRRRGTPPPGAKKLSLQEPGLVELKDGRLMMYARSNERRQWRLFSTDGGEHWTEPEPVTEYATTTFSPVTYARLADGRLVVVFNDGAAHADKAPDRLERRWPLAIGVSSDEGRSWTKKLLEPDDPSVSVHACYSAVREIDGRLVLVYCHRDMLATTRVVAVPMAWLPSLSPMN